MRVSMSAREIHPLFHTGAFCFAAHYRVPQFESGFRAFLLVANSDLMPFIVVENGNIRRARHRPGGELKGRSDIEKRPPISESYLPIGFRREINHAPTLLKH